MHLSRDDAVALFPASEIRWSPLSPPKLNGTSHRDTSMQTSISLFKMEGDGAGPSCSNCARGWPATRVAELGVGPDVQCQRICRWQVRTTCSVGTGFVFGGGACHCVNCAKEEAGLLPEKDLRPGQSESRILIKTEKNCRTCWQRCCMTLS